ncbi:MAG: hypothetical protein IPL61_40310 [Myxococcales bacterium]|nr:hypothetical protein [Myxococcales bacterium]
MRPIYLRLIPLFALVLAVLAPSVAHAQPDPRVEARAHYQAGMARFNAAQYDEAVAEFRAADQILPSPVNDYNIGLALERKGDAGAAIKAYRAYLDRSPNAANRAEVEASITRLTPAASAADAAAAEAARQAAEQAAAAEAARRAAEQAAAATRPAPTGTNDPELDRVAAVDLQALRATPLPPPSAAASPTPPANGAAPAPASPTGDTPKKSSRPFYKSPVFWVLAAVGVYVVIVLADSGSSNNAQPGRALVLPEGAPRMSAGPAVFSF